MKTNYLFDDEDKKQRGIGVDRLGDKNDGLKLKWKSNHHQTGFTKIGKYKLETIFWHDSYEARVSYRDEIMESISDIYKSRIEAQIGAEKLLVKILKNGQKILENFISQREVKSDPRFKLPTDKQLIEIALLFNNGKIQPKRLADMVAMAELIIDRLYENGDVLVRCSKESLNYDGEEECEICKKITILKSDNLCEQCWNQLPPQQPSSYEGKTVLRPDSQWKLLNEFENKWKLKRDIVTELLSKSIDKTEDLKLLAVRRFINDVLSDVEILLNINLNK
ncbi:MAG TPA: hypothetical protein DF296_13690 [Candidatus Margulisbacteria bacterium]|nr:hypothetical protein [Candidatus Margulisiibacteriota bacterium]